MAIVKCPNCGNEISDESEVCIYCYADIEKVKQQKIKEEKQKEEEKQRAKEERERFKKMLPSRNKVFAMLVFSILLLFLALGFLIDISIIDKYKDSISNLQSQLIIIIFILLSLTSFLVGLALLINCIKKIKSFFTGEATILFNQLQEAKREQQRLLEIEEAKKAQEMPVKKTIKCNVCERIVPFGTKKCIYCNNEIDEVDRFDINDNLGDKKIEIPMRKLGPNYNPFLVYMRGKYRFWGELDEDRMIDAYYEMLTFDLVEFVIEFGLYISFLIVSFIVYLVAFNTIFRMVFFSQIIILFIFLLFVLLPLSILFGKKKIIIP